MIDRRIGKIKVRRGTDLQRKQIVFEESEIIYTTDTKRTFIGDNTTQGANKVSNINFISNSDVIPSRALYGDLLYNKSTNITYIIGYELDGITLKLIPLINGNVIKDLKLQIDNLENTLKELTGCLQKPEPEKPPKPDIPLQWVIEPVSKSAAIGTSVTFTASAIGPIDDIVYSWERRLLEDVLLVTEDSDFIITENDSFIQIQNPISTSYLFVKIPGAIGTTYTIPKVSIEDYVFYRCIANSSVGSLTSVEAELTNSGKIDDKIEVIDEEVETFYILGKPKIYIVSRNGEYIKWL
jgi:hypothetical protein